MIDVCEITVNDDGTLTIVERPYTQAEAAQRAVDEAAAAQAEADRIAAEQFTTQARADAIAHAKSLGFTDAMIAVMYPGLAS